ncbi:MAG: UDP-N-acetylmuramate dehydrogenase [Mariprofundaceae bacterium]|nr:UDP-N-acetylmuramate dehydrogenase [Mariprofundaceae bacterium]
MSWQQSVSRLGRFDEQIPLATHTTLSIGGPARWFFRPDGEAELAEALKLIPAGTALLPLGRGSNLLVPDRGFDGVVIDFGELDTIAANGSELVADAGARMGKIAQQCANHGLTGLEFMATVPGDLGGGIAMNAGAFGQQVSDTLCSVRLLLRSGEISTLKRDQLQMDYRRTILPEGALVTSACFELQHDDVEAIRARMREMRRQRSSSQPLSLPNCGSVFKNPPGDHAARLIEAAGLKGTKIGNARISSTHANFIVNEGKASSEDVLTLIRMAQQAVEEKFGVHLEPEVRILGGVS